MEELLNKLIEIDRQARIRVEEAEKTRSQLLDEIEKKKKKLVEKSETVFYESLEKEKNKQAQILSEQRAVIEKNLNDGIETLKLKNEKNSDRWVDMIVNNIISVQ
ncbi:MAG: hypothetical protein ACI4XE_08465 [Acutalibacteraceae bacterium]